MYPLFEAAGGIGAARILGRYSDYRDQTELEHFEGIECDLVVRGVLAKALQHGIDRSSPHLDLELGRQGPKS